MTSAPSAKRRVHREPRAIHGLRQQAARRERTIISAVITPELNERLRALAWENRLTLSRQVAHALDVFERWESALKAVDEHK